MTFELEIERRPDFPIPPERLEAMWRWHTEALRQAYEARDIEEIERLCQNEIENFARQGMIADGLV